MPKNKITHERIDNGYLQFKGTLRQPTMVEIENYVNEKRLSLEGLYVSAVNITGGYTHPEDCKTLTIIQYVEECPVCGNEHDLFFDHCPVCRKKWE
ncbi:MAG: hypothetical protein RSF13_09300 [Clostridiales bacterium]